MANLFSLRSYPSGAISELGAHTYGWMEARAILEVELGEAKGLLLTYGVRSPTRPAREHYLSQTAWLNDRIIDLALPCWWGGNAPRHPSR